MSPTTTVPEEAVETTETAPLTGSQRTAVARLVRALRGYSDARKAYAGIARAIVSLRLTFEKDGRQDFRGEHPKYRLTVATLYEQVIPDADERQAFKVSIRYWIGKEFASRVEKGEIALEDLQAVGMMLQPSARERRVEVIPEGPLGVLEHVEKQLVVVVEALKDEKVRSGLPEEPLRQSITHLLALVVTAASDVGIDVEAYFEEWVEEHAGPVAA